jgi:AcrR family transcriptional regulator
VTQTPATRATPGTADARPASLPGTRRRGETLRRSIFEATLELLRTTGYADLTMERVAAAAGTGKAALYRRWSDREALVADALRNALPDPTAVELTGRPREDIIALLGCLADTAELSRDAAYQVAKRDAGLDSGLSTMIQTRVLDPCGERVLEVLRRGIEAGELRAGMANPRVGDIGPAMLIHYAVTNGPPIPDEYVVSIVDDVIMPLVSRR